MTIWDSLTGRKSSTSYTTTNKSSQPSNNDPNPPINVDTSSDSPGGYAYSTPKLPDFLSDPSILHPISGLDSGSLDYLKLEDSVLSDLPGSKGALPSRGFADDLCYGTGMTYLSALGIGGALGFVEGLRKVPANSPPKIKLNSILNGITRRGPFLGNSAGVVALLYNGINSGIGNLRGKHDHLNSISAGFISGAIFKSTRGSRPMLISGALVGTAAGVWSFGREFLQ